MSCAENHMTQSIIRSTNPNDTQLSFSKIQAYIGVWLDNTCKQETYDSIKTALLDVFDSLKTYTEFWKCLTYINKDRPGKIIFIVSYEIGKNLIPLIFRQDPSPIEYIYVYSIDETQQHNWDFQKPDKLRDGFTTVHRLIKQIIIDIREFNERAETIAPKITPSTSITTTFDDAGGTTTSNDVITSRRHDHCLPPPSFFSENIQNTSIKDLNADSAWFIQFQLLVEILIRMTNSEQAKTDIVFVCREHYKEDKSQQTKIDRFEKEADDLSKTIYWYTRESFIVHLLNKVCGTEDADDLYKFRLFIRNLHYRIVEMNNDNLTVQLKRKEVVLYRGKRVAASTFENFRNSINGLVVMKGFLSTTMDPKVAEFFAGGDVTQMGFVNVLFKLKIDNWEKCKPAAAIDPAYSAMEDEQEVLFSIGTIWRILNVNELSDGMWCIELASCQEENARSIELTNYLKEQLGETSDLWTLADFLMKKGEFDKAENYYTKLENELNLPEKHADRAEIYNRLGLIRREQNELRLAAEYFEKAIKAAPPHNDIEATAKYNLKISEEDRKRKPLSFLGKRIGSSDITIKSLAANHASIPLVENNLGNVAWHEGNYNLAFMHYQTAVSAMAESKLTYLREISCVYNNLGAVAYSKEDYSGAKDYFEKAIFTLQQLNRRHPWIAEYIENLAYAQRKIVMKRPLTNIHGTIF